MASDSLTKRAVGQETAAPQPEGQCFHWMPVFCQMRGMSGYPGAGPGSPAGPWGSSMANIHVPLGPQGGLQPYPFMGVQPSMPTPIAAATVASQSQRLTEPGLPTAVVAKPSQHAIGLTHTAGTGNERGMSAGDQQQSETASPSTTCDSAQTQQRSKDAVLNQSAVDRQPLGVATCMPQLVKQLSNRSSEDLTARAVAKLWGVNLRRYTGRSS